MKAIGSLRSSARIVAEELCKSIAEGCKELTESVWEEMDASGEKESGAMLLVSCVISRS